MKAKDIIAPKIKAECRIDEHGVLWVDTKQWEKVNRVIVREKGGGRAMTLISREDAMGAVQDHFNAYGFKGYYDGQRMMDRINALPPAGLAWMPLPEPYKGGDTE